MMWRPIISSRQNQKTIATVFRLSTRAKAARAAAAGVAGNVSQAAGPSASGMGRLAMEGFCAAGVRAATPGDERGSKGRETGQEATNPWPAGVHFRRFAAGDHLEPTYNRRPWLQGRMQGVFRAA